MTEEVKKKQPSKARPRRINALRKEHGLSPHKWVICVICGEWCPGDTEGFFSQFDHVHMTCRYDKKYEALIKKAAKQKTEDSKLLLFDL
jgi:hypothetical protein